jgi:methyl-accepting chemotaxis protein
MSREHAGGEGRLPTLLLSGVMLLTALAIGGLVWGVYNAHVAIETLSTSNLRVEQLRGSILHLDEVLTMSARMAVETGDLGWEKRYREFEPGLSAAIEEASTLVPGEMMRAAVRSIDATNRLLVEKEEGAFELVRARKVDEARALLLSQAYVSEKERYSQAIGQLERALQSSAGAVAQKARRGAGVQLGVALAAIPLLLASWWIALRTLTRWRAILGANHSRLSRQAEELSRLLDRGQRTGRQVAASAEQLAASNLQLESVVDEHVASTQSASADARRIAASAEQLTRTVAELATISGQAATGAESGRVVLDRLVEAMVGMVGATETIASYLTAIQASADRITSVIGTMTVVADQTNLLSLNAAIEAEKAGVHGRGFLVVAREIRRLADQTAISALEIEASIEAMRASVAAGVGGIERFDQGIRRGASEARGVVEQLTQFITEVRDLSLRFETVRAGMENQAQGAQQIGIAMTQLDAAARQTADSLLSSKAAIGHLERTIHELTASQQFAGVAESTGSASPLLAM